MAGLEDIAYTSVMKCDKDIRGGPYRNIVLSGGSMAVTGMRERMASKLPIIVKAPHCTRYLSWKGGSVLAGVSQFESMCIRGLED